MKVDLKTVRDLFNPNIKECPYCGCENYYYKQQMSDLGDMWVSFDKDKDNETDYGDMHENLKYTPIEKFAYCCGCEKKIFRFRA